MRKVFLIFSFLFLLAGIKNIVLGQSYRDKCADYIPNKWVANKGLSVKGMGHFPGSFRIKVRDRYISIEGRRYIIESKEKNIKFQGNDCSVLYKTTYYPPSGYSEKPSVWHIAFFVFPDEGWNMTYDAWLYNADKEYFCAYSGGAYTIKKGADGNPYCLDCWSELYDSF